MSVTQLRQTRDAGPPPRLRRKSARSSPRSRWRFPKRSPAAGSLLSTMSVARASAGISPIAGQPAFAQIAAALNSLAQSMESTAAGHYTLNRVRKDLRIPVTSFGDTNEIPGP